MQPILVGDQAGLAHDLLRCGVLRPMGLKNTVVVLARPEEVAARLRTTPGGLGLLPAAPDDLKVLSLAMGPGGVAFEPTLGNVYAGDYPLRVPWRLVLPRAAAGEHLVSSRFLLGDEAATAMNAHGLVPLPSAVRQQLAFDLEGW